MKSNNHVRGIEAVAMGDGSWGARNSRPSCWSKWKEVGGAPLGPVASRERRGQGRADYRPRVEALEMERGAAPGDGEDASRKAGDGRAVEAGNDADDSANRPTTGHGKLEKPEQQVIFGRQARCERIEIEKGQKVKSYGLTPSTRFPAWQALMIHPMARLLLPQSPNQPRWRSPV